jgi:hypothetical protein
VVRGVQDVQVPARSDIACIHLYKTFFSGILYKLEEVPIKTKKEKRESEEKKTMKDLAKNLNELNLKKVFWRP